MLVTRKLQSSLMLFIFKCSRLTGNILFGTRPRGGHAPRRVSAPSHTDGADTPDQRDSLETRCRICHNPAAHEDEKTKAHVPTFYDARQPRSVSKNKYPLRIHHRSIRANARHVDCFVNPWFYWNIDEDETKTTNDRECQMLPSVPV